MNDAQCIALTHAVKIGDVLVAHRVPHYRHATDRGRTPNLVMALDTFEVVGRDDGSAGVFEGMCQGKVLHEPAHLPDSRNVTLYNGGCGDASRMA